jgi:hypothetical protein
MGAVLPHSGAGFSEGFHKHRNFFARAPRVHEHFSFGARAPLTRTGAFSGKVDTGFLQKMRPARNPNYVNHFTVN